jgi:hypothetical protein
MSQTRISLDCLPLALAARDLNSGYVASLGLTDVSLCGFHVELFAQHHCISRPISPAIIPCGRPITISQDKPPGTDIHNDRPRYILKPPLRYRKPAISRRAELGFSCPAALANKLSQSYPVDYPRRPRLRQSEIQSSYFADRTRS